MSTARKLYPVQTTPNLERYLSVGIHTIYFAEYGNPKGIPLVICHGGPGSGTRAWYAGYANPEIYRIILIDQRGAGKSTPKGCTVDNTTQDLINDMEIIRTLLNIKQWAVLGGSWGSTLGLLYAEAHPECVLGLILRGVYLARSKDSRAFVRDGCSAALFYPTEWETFKENLNSLLKQADINTQNDVIYDIYALLTQPNNDLKMQAAGLLGAWEDQCAYLVAPKPDDTISPDSVNMGLMETTYIRNKLYIKENQILDNIASIAHLPIFIVQGIYDIICPRYQSIDLENALKKLKGSVTRFDTISGHAGDESEIINYLVTSTDKLAEILSLTMAKTFNHGLQSNSMFAPSEEKDETKIGQFSSLTTNFN